MSPKPQAAYADAHREASKAFRSLTPEQMRQRLREAGVLGITPQIGDKVRVLDRHEDWHYGVVVGTDAAGRISVVHNGANGVVEVSPLERFADGSRVQMVQRAPAGREYEAAAQAASLLRKRYDLANFDAATLPAAAPAPNNGARIALGVALAAVGLLAVAVLLSDDAEWDESAGRYRDARGRFAPG